MCTSNYTVICYFFGVEIFSDGALRPKFCYANIFPIYVNFLHLRMCMHAKHVQRRTTSIFPLLLSEQDQPRMSILRYFKPPLPLYERLASLALHSKFFRTGNIFGRCGASENKVTRKFIKRKFCERKKGKLRYLLKFKRTKFQVQL